MKKNVIASTLSGSSKIFLLICLASAFAADLAVFVMLLVQDAGVSYWIFPLLFLLADALFIAQAVFSNFRFVYTVWQIVIWCVLTAVMLICTVVLNICGDVTVFTNAAAALIIALHAIALLAVITCYLYASRRIAGGKNAQTSVTVLATVLSVALVAFYGVFLGYGGFFGQGFAIRPVSYIYDELTDGYEAVSTVGTKGDTVVVPEEFNGKKVTAVSAGLFYEVGVQNVYLECSADVKITDEEKCISSLNGELTVYTGKKDIDKFKNKFYAIASARADKSAYATPALELANATVPYDVEDGEVYVTFSYDYDAFIQAERKPLPTWFGRKGQSIDLSYFKDIPYAMHADSLSDNDLYWCYENTKDKVIMSDFTIEGGSAARSADAGNSVLTKVENGVTAKVSFEKIYKVFAGQSNDMLHSADTEFDFAVIGGVKVNYKLTTANNADRIIAPYKRDGFSLNWNYSHDYSSVEFTSLSEALKVYRYSELNINPVWSVNKPVLSLKTDCANDTAIYGDDITLTANATAPAEGFKLDYAWSSGASGVIDCDTPTYKKEMIKRTEAGYYTVSVTASVEGSSLTAVSYQAIDVKVERRPVTIEWTIPQNVVYDKQPHEVTCAIRAGDILTFNGVQDKVGLTVPDFTYQNAGTYAPETGLNGTDKDNYIISNGSHTNKFTIAPKALTVTVTAVSKYYDGDNVNPVCTATGYVDDYDKDHVLLYPEGAASSAGVHQLGCRLGTNTLDKNYYIANDDFGSYEIYKQPLNLTWTVYGGDGFTYDGTNHSVSIDAVGTEGGEKDSSCSYAVTSSVPSIRDAGTHNVSVHILNPNYEILSGGTYTFTVKKRVVSAVKRGWAEQEVIYDGYEKAPYFVIDGVGQDAGKTIYVDGTGGIHAGEHTFVPKSVRGEYANNYELAENVTGSFGFTIKPASVFIEWTNSFVYDGKAHVASANCYGWGLDGQLNMKVTVTGSNLTDGKAINAGTYTATAQVLDGGSGKYLATDYQLINAQISMSITRATLTVTADSKTVAANQPFNLTYTVTGFVNGETAASTGLNVSSIFVSGHQGATSLPAGTYTIYVSGTQVLTNYYINYVTGTLTVTRGN